MALVCSKNQIKQTINCAILYRVLFTVPYYAVLHSVLAPVEIELLTLMLYWPCSTVQDHVRSLQSNAQAHKQFSIFNWNPLAKCNGGRAHGQRAVCIEK